MAGRMERYKSLPELHALHSAPAKDEYQMLPRLRHCLGLNQSQGCTKVKVVRRERGCLCSLHRSPVEGSDSPISKVPTLRSMVIHLYQYCMEQSSFSFIGGQMCLFGRARAVSTCTRYKGSLLGRGG